MIEQSLAAIRRDAAIRAREQHGVAMAQECLPLMRIDIRDARQERLLSKRRLVATAGAGVAHSARYAASAVTSADSFANPSAPNARPTSRRAMSRYSGFVQRFAPMPANQAPTT